MFHPKNGTKYSSFIMPSFLLQLQTLNNQLKMRGELKAIGGGWFFCCCKILTAKIGQQRKEESHFLYEMKRT
jgi:hypothetical protein